MISYFVSHHMVESLVFGENDMGIFNKQLYKLLHFFQEQKESWNSKVVINTSIFDEGFGFDLHDVRMLLSFSVDTPRFCTAPREYKQSKEHAYFLVPSNPYETFKETNDPVYLEMSETEGPARIIDSAQSYLSILRIHRYSVSVLPSLKNFVSSNLENAVIEIFLEKYVKRLFENADDQFQDFGKNCFQFFSTFNWNNWSPRNQPAPGHELLLKLMKFYKRKNDDVHHLRWGYIMSFLNGGRRNKQITAANSHDPRINDIFQCGIGKGKDTIFFSIDTENGALELYDYRGIHMDKVYILDGGIKVQKRNYTIEAPQHLWHQ